MFSTSFVILRLFFGRQLLDLCNRIIGLFLVFFKSLQIGVIGNQARNFSKETKLLLGPEILVWLSTPPLHYAVTCSSVLRYLKVETFGHAISPYLCKVASVVNARGCLVCSRHTHLICFSPSIFLLWISYHAGYSLVINFVLYIVELLQLWRLSILEGCKKVRIANAHCHLNALDSRLSYHV